MFHKGVVTLLVAYSGVRGSCAIRFDERDPLVVGSALPSKTGSTVAHSYIRWRGAAKSHSMAATGAEGGAGGAGDSEGEREGAYGRGGRMRAVGLGKEE